MSDIFLNVAKKAALEAGKVISKYSGGKLDRKIKKNDSSDFATKADLEAEKVIIKTIKDNFPDHNIVAEEGTNIDKKSEYTWAVDPLDGTLSFAVGVPSFTVSIGLLKNNEPIVGVIYHIADNDLYYAQKDKGAFLNNMLTSKKIAVKKKDDLESAIVSMDFGHKRSRLQKFNEYGLPFIPKVGYIYSLGSGALALAYSAKGVFEAHFHIGGLWDILAGTLIIREAGGRVTDFKGQELDFSKERFSIIASNGLIHDQILEVLR